LILDRLTIAGADSFLPTPINVENYRVEAPFNSPFAIRREVSGKVNGKQDPTVESKMISPVLAGPRMRLIPMGNNV
jgi:hypothetical protein